MEYIKFKEHINLIPFNNLLKEGKESMFITESLGSFEKQGKIANDISELFFKMFLSKEKEIETTISIDGEDINLVLVLESNGFLLNSKADILPYGTKSDNNIYTIEKFLVRLFLSQNDVEMGQERVKARISSIISHELGHGNIFLKRAEAKQDIEVADWYSKIISIIRNDNISQVVHLFAYAIYSCYYHERQAIVSSTYSQLSEMYPKNRLSQLKNNLRKIENQNEKYRFLLKSYKEDLIKTESYKTFYTTLYVLPREINTNTEKEIKRVFAMYDINIDVKKELSKIKLLSMDALKSVTKNGSLFFNEVLLKELEIK